VSRLVVLTFILGFELMAGPGRVGASDFTFSAGAGYEFISQEFFLDSLERSGLDSLEFTTALKTTYLNDFRGRFEVLYAPRSTGALEIRSRLEQSTDFIRAKLFTEASPELGFGRLEVNTEIDWRTRHSDSVGPGDDYFYGRGRARLRIPAGASLTAKTEVSADFVRFDSSSELSYNYERFGGKAGIGISMPNFSLADFGVFLLSRRVSDSSRLNYLSYGAEGSYFGFYDQGDLDLMLRAEHRDYDRPRDTADYWRLELDGRNKTKLGGGWFAAQRLESESWFFVQSDLVNYDFTRAGLKILGGKEFDALSVALGGAFEVQAELDQAVAISDDYFETGLASEIEYFRSSQLFLVLESVLGYRSIKDETELQSSFGFERLTLIGDWQLLGSLGLSVLFSAEWEWHENEQENNHLYLISSSLDYQF
jgi:hypothetical protein